MYRHAVDEDYPEQPIVAGTVTDLLKRRARAAGVEPTTVRRLSGHSMRVGVAQAMAAAGIELVAIMHAGGLALAGNGDAIY